jgi:hypothetical protein
LVNSYHPTVFDLWIVDKEIGVILLKDRPNVEDDFSSDCRKDRVFRFFMLCRFVDDVNAIGILMNVSHVNEFPRHVEVAILFSSFIQNECLLIRYNLDCLTQFSINVWIPSCTFFCVGKGWKDISNIYLFQNEKSFYLCWILIVLQNSEKISIVSSTSTSSMKISS